MTYVDFEQWLKQRPMEEADASLEARIMAQAQLTSQQSALGWKLPQPVYGVFALALVGVFLTVGQPSSQPISDDITDEQLLAEIFYYDDDTLF